MRRVLRQLLYLVTFVLGILGVLQYQSWSLRSRGDEEAMHTSRYTVTGIGTLGGESTWADSLNSKAQVTGLSATSGGEFHAFVWAAGKMKDIGTLGGRRSYGKSINNRGFVTGSAETADGKEVVFLFSGDRMRNLGISGVGNSLNNKDEVVGRTESSRAFLYYEGTVKDLGTLGGSYGQATAINENGQIAGTTSVDASNQHAFLWERGRMRDLGTLGFHYSHAYGIGQSGKVVGDSPPDGWGSHAFIWEDGKMIDLGTLHGSYSEATAVNGTGEVVGYSYVGPGENDTHAVLWMNGRALDLNDAISAESGWKLRRATGINDKGQIICTGVGPGHLSTRSCLLTPRKGRTTFGDAPGSIATAVWASWLPLSTALSTLSLFWR